VPVTPQNVELDNDVISGGVTYPHGLEMAYINVEHLQPHPLNANSTDTTPIVESIHMNGFIQPLLVQTSTGYIIDGWHRYTAAIELGATTIPVILYDCDDATARRLLVAINRTARLGTDDPGLLRDLMDTIAAEDARLLGTGWTPLQYESFLELIETPYQADVEDYNPVRQHHTAITCPSCGAEFGGRR
jgi:hypothetical protein